MTGSERAELGHWGAMYGKRASRLVKDVAAYLGVTDAEDRIVTEVTLNSDFNAKAFLEDGERGGRISINLGAAFLSEDYFLRLLSHGKVWPEVGASKDERLTPLLRDTYRNAQDLFLVGVPDAEIGPNESYSRPQPKCPIRQTYAGWLHAILWDYLVMHELGHILHGHIAYLRAEGVAKATESDVWHASDLLTRQALEMDADCFAVDMVLRVRGPDAPHESLGRPTDLALRRVCLALDVFRSIYTSFTLTPGGGDRFQHRRSGAHPPSRVRQSLILAGLLSWVGRDSEALACQLLTREALQIEEHYGHVTGESSDSSGVVELLGDPIALEIMDRWRSLLPGLEGHAWVKLPIPSPDWSPAG